MSFGYNLFDDEKKIKFSRLLTDDNIPDIKLSRNFQKYFPFHWGQRKLFYSELEFLSIVAENEDLSDFLVIYIGAADGSHHNLLHTFFEKTMFLLYDSRQYDKSLDKLKNYILKTGNEGFFKDETINEVKQYAKKYNKKIIYINDMRTRELENLDFGFDKDKIMENEKMIWNDMLKQQEWGIKMDAEYMLLKFRCPDMDDTMLQNVTDEINYSDEKGKMKYLKGQIFTQIYPPKKSFETRLYVKKNKNKYDMDLYNLNEYTKKITQYNLFIRGLQHSFLNSDDMFNHLLGYTNNYDCVTEYYIINLYNKNYLKKSHDHKYIIQNLCKINTFFNNNSENPSIIFGVYHTYIQMIAEKIQHLYKFTINEKTIVNYKNLNKVFEINERTTRLIHFALTLPPMIQKTFIKQISNKSNILTNEEYEKHNKSYEGKNVLFPYVQEPCKDLKKSKYIAIINENNNMYITYNTLLNLQSCMKRINRNYFEKLNNK